MPKNAGPLRSPLRKPFGSPASGGPTGKAGSPAATGTGFGGYDLPQPPTGYSYIVDADGSYLLDSDGSFLIEVT